MPSAISSAGPTVALAPAYAAGGAGRRTAIGFALLAVGLTAALAMTSASRHSVLVALARTAAVGVPIAVGFHARYRRRHDRFGLLLIATGAGAFLTTFAESSDESLYSIGRVAGWLFEVLLVYVILSFPTGRLQGRVDRALVGAMAGV